MLPEMDNYGTNSTSQHTTSSGGGGSQAVLNNVLNNSKNSNNLQNASMSSFQNINAATSSIAIRTEIARFEGMHPKIFEIL